MNLLLESGMGDGSWVMILLLGLLVIMFVVSIFRNKKANKERVEMMSNLKVGDSIITNAAVFGKIVSMRETTIGRVYVIETGNENNKSYFEVHANAIMEIDTKRDIILDANGNDITFADEDNVQEKNDETSVETPTNENQEDIIDELVKPKEEETSKPKKTKKSNK